jgi:glycosyltransferase involved in cell wall biosynthesis
MPEIIREGFNGFFAERSVNGLCRAIEKLKRADMTTLSNNARSSVLEGWTWRDQVRKYEAMFRALIAKRYRSNDYTNSIATSSEPHAPI